MLKKREYEKILEKCLSTGADFSEIYYENAFYNNIEMLKKVVRSVNSKNTHGCGIRILKGLEEVYGYTNDCSYNGMMNLARGLANRFNDSIIQSKVNLLKEEIPLINNLNTYSKDVKNKVKIEIMEKASSGALTFSEKITQCICRLSDETKFVTIMNSKGLYRSDIRSCARLVIVCIAEEGSKKEQAVDSYGGNFHLSKIGEIDLLKFGADVASVAIRLLDSKEIKGGVYDVVIHNGFGGVIFHEACGHSLEATAVAKGLSVFSDKIGQKIASDVVNAIDDGTIEEQWGSITIDDEGILSQKNILIEDGILKGYLIDYLNARRMDMETTGSARRQSYRYSPTSRMTNTYIANGKSTFEEIIKNTKYGLFAKSMGGGSVNPATGEFNFSVAEGYMIEDGKITYPVKGATLIGSGQKTLLNIDMVADNLEFGYGVCGSVSGHVNTCVGQPTIRVLKMTVGGRGSEEDGL